MITLDQPTGQITSKVDRSLDAGDGNNRFWDALKAYNSLNAATGTLSLAAEISLVSPVAGALLVIVAAVEYAAFGVELTKVFAPEPMAKSLEEASPFLTPGGMVLGTGGYAFYGQSGYSYGSRLGAVISDVHNISSGFEQSPPDFLYQLSSFKKLSDDFQKLSDDFPKLYNEGIDKPPSDGSNILPSDSSFAFDDVVLDNPVESLPSPTPYYPSQPPEQHPSTSSSSQSQPSEDDDGE
jgi:hypothetical protein